MPFDAENVKPGMIVIAGNAFPDSHEEIQRAKELGLEVIRYHDFIADFIQNYTSIAVTGSLWENKYDRSIIACIDRDSSDKLLDW